MEVMNKAAHLQTQVKQNNADLTDFLKDLTRWEEKVKHEDKNLKSERELEEKLPPVRSRTQKKKSVEPCATPKVKGNKEARISSYDYDAWSKFDVAKACESVEKEDENDEKGEQEIGSGSDDENNEAIDQVRIQQSIQKSIMEKEKGNQMFKEGKYDAAINRYTSAISLNPRNPVLYANRGMALLKKEHFAAAEQDCDVALQLDPSYSKAISRRGTARKKMKKYTESLDDFNLLLKVEPTNQQAKNEIKELKVILSRNDEKGKSKIEALSSDQGNVDAKSRTRRSNKPLKRIPITEIGFDESESKENQKSKTKKSQSTVKVASVETFELLVPVTSFMFETEFKKLKNDEEKLYQYMKIIPIAEYNKLFYHSVDNVISPFLSIFKNCYVRYQVPFHKEMEALARLSRFQMAVMFLSGKDKEIVKQLLGIIKSDSYGHQLLPGTVEEISQKYGVK